METIAPQVDALVQVDVRTWRPDVDPASSDQFALALEQGKVLCLPLPFALSESERAFLSPAWLSGKRKNISLDGNQVGGASGPDSAMAGLGAMIRRYAGQSTELIARLFPRYRNHLRQARTSFRPGLVQGPAPSCRKDDSRLHVDAFPSRPNHGERILRVETAVTALLARLF